MAETQVHEEPGHAAEPAPAHHGGPTVRVYLRVAAILGVLTAFEVWLTLSNFSRSLPIGGIFFRSRYGAIWQMSEWTPIKCRNALYARFEHIR